MSKIYSMTRSDDPQSTARAILDHASRRAAWTWLAKDRFLEERQNGRTRPGLVTWKLRLFALLGRQGVMSAPFAGLEGRKVPQCVYSVIEI